MTSEILGVPSTPDENHSRTHFYRFLPFFKLEIDFQSFLTLMRRLQIYSSEVDQSSFESRVDEVIMARISSNILFKFSGPNEKGRII